MFAAIGFVWTVVGIIGSNLVARKIKEREISRELIFNKNNGGRRNQEYD